MNRLALSVFLAVALLPQTPLLGQSASAVWSLNSTSTITASTSGLVTAQNEVLSGGTNPTLSITGYVGQGQSLSSTGNSGWNASPEAPDRYIQFDAAPAVGYSWTVTSVSFEYGAAVAAGHVESNVRYSIDGGANWTLLNTGGPLAYQASSMAVYSATTNVTVPAGDTFSLRIHPYAVVSQNAAAPQRAVHNSVLIGGTTQESPSDGRVTGGKFLDDNGNGELESGEVWLPGVTIELKQGGQVVQTAVTDANGLFEFFMPAGSYTLEEVVPAGQVPTVPANGIYTFTIASGEYLEAAVFGNKWESVTGMCLDKLPTGMYGWWSGDMTAADRSGFGNDASYSGTYGPGQVASAFLISQPSNVAVVPDSPAFDLPGGQDFALDLWFRTGSTFDQYLLTKFDPAGSGSGFRLMLNGAGVLFFSAYGTSPSSVAHISSGTGLNDNNWHFASISVDRDSPTGYRMKVDGLATAVLDPTGWQSGSLDNTSPFLIGGSNLPGQQFHFRGSLDEIEFFRRAVTDAEFEAIFAAGPDGKCKDDTGTDNCAEKVTELSVSTGYDHPASTTYAIGSHDAYWFITADPDPTQTVPRPASVTAPNTPWGSAQTGSVWLGPAEVLPDPANPPHLYQAAVGLGLYVYTLEFCLVGEDADRLDFNLSVLSDNAATVKLIDTQGTVHAVGLAPANISIPAGITASLPGPWVAGTYRLVVEVHNDAIPPDFTGLNLAGSITGANLQMQKSECCNADGHLTGTKYLDLDGDGKFSESDVLGGVTIVVKNMADGTVYTTTTDAYGNYYFDVPPGTYVVLEDVPTGYIQTEPVGGGYEVTVGPGGMVSNLDFVNKPVPCVSTSAAWSCTATGQTYLQLTVVNQTNVPVYSATATSQTSGVTATVFGTAPANPYPVAPGGQLVLNISLTGLSPGAQADLKIELRGQANANGVAENCCLQTVRITRPTGFYCPYVIWGTLNWTGVAADVSPAGWVVRGRVEGGTPKTTMTNSEGMYWLEGLTEGMYTVSVDEPYGFTTMTPASGAYTVQVSAREPETRLDFTLSPGASHTATEESGDGIPTEYFLDSNYPNPFNPTTTILFGLPEAAHVRLSVYDILGRPVAQLLDATLSAGRHQAQFDASALAGGLYFYTLTTGTYSSTRKMMLLK